MRLSTLLQAAAVLLVCASPAAAQSEKAPQSVKQPSKSLELSLDAQPAIPMARNAVFTETFDATADGALPAGWTQFEAGTGLPAGTTGASVWGVISYSATNPALGKAMRIAFENVPSGLATDYLVTPPIVVGTAEQLQVSLAEQFAVDYASTYEIRLSTTTAATPAAFSVLLASYTEATLPTISEGALRASFNLSAYAGQTVYLAFVFKNDDGDTFIIDDVSVAPAPVTPAITVTPATLSFGNRLTGSAPAAQTVTVRNTGGSTLTISPSLVGAGASQYTLDLTGMSILLPPGASTTFRVAFAPTTTGAAAASVSIASNAPGSPTLVALSGTGVIPPPNDNRASAAVVAGPGTVTGTNVGASLESDEPVPSCQVAQNNSVWWSYTPPSAGLLTLDLSASTFDTVLTVYQPGTTQIGCDDDSGDANTSRLLNVPVAGGQPVLIRVAGYRSLAGVVAEGTISYTVNFSAGSLVTTAIPPGNTTGRPTFARPSSVGTGASGSCSISTSGTATPYQLIPITVSAGGGYTITTITSTAGYDGFLLLYRGPFLPADPCRNLVALDDDGTAAVNDSEIQTVLTPGAYSLVVTGFDNGDFGAYSGTLVGPGATLTTAGETDADDARATFTVMPNPVHGASRVRLVVDTAQRVSVSVYDVTGRAVAQLFDSAVAAGQALDVNLDASVLPAGVYVVRAVGESVRLTRRITVVR